MLLCTLTTGDAVHRYNKRIVVQFKGPRKVLSTSILNGGYREDLKAVFNHDCSTGNDTDCTLRAPTYEEHMRLNAQDLGLSLIHIFIGQISQNTLGRSGREMGQAWGKRIFQLRPAFCQGWTATRS